MRLNHEISEKYTAQMQVLESCGDYEWAHYKADELLIEMLKELGYTNIVEAWDKVGKWYA